MYGIIYKITNNVNGKVYIGQTIKSLEERWVGHLYSAINPKPEHAHRKIVLALRKYGAENFTKEIIDYANSESELNDKEIYWITHYNSEVDGYNMTSGGNQNRMFDYNLHPDSENIKRKMSQSKIGANNPNARKIKCKNINTDKELFFDCLADAARYFRPNAPRGGHHSDSFISKRLNRGAKKLYNNEWLFAYQEEEYTTDYKLSSSPTLSGDTTIMVEDIETKNEYNFKSLKDLTSALPINKGTFSTMKNRYGSHFKIKNYVIDILI